MSDWIDAFAKKISTRGGALLVALALGTAAWTGLTFTAAAVASWVNRRPMEMIERVSLKLDTLSTQMADVNQRINEGARRDSIFAKALQHPLWSDARQGSLEEIANGDDPKTRVRR